MNKQVLEDLIEKDYSSYQIAAFFNKSQTSIRHWLNKFGLKTKHFKIGKINYQARNHGKLKDKKLWEEIGIFIQDHTWREVMEKFDISFATISKAKKLGLIKTRSTSQAIKAFLSKETSEEKLQRITKIKNGIKNSSSSFGGYREGAGRSKKFKVFDSFKQPVTLQSSYEFRFVNILNKMNINWIRPSFLPYKIEGKTKKYFPDFYLVDQKIYIDTKNDYLIKIDSVKIKLVEDQNNLKINILSKDKINEEFVKNLIMRPKLQ